MKSVKDYNGKDIKKGDTVHTGGQISFKYKVLRIHKKSKKITIRNSKSPKIKVKANQYLIYSEKEQVIRDELYKNLAFNVVSQML